MSQIVTNKISQVARLCRRHRVESMYVFGSANTDTFNAHSDIDVMVSFGDVDLLEHFNNLVSFKQGLEKIFARPVDLLEENAIQNPVLLRSINLNKQLIYGRAN